MKCPKCGGEIAFFDLKPNCKHCGVNIMYFTQEADLIRDAKRTELDSASARMVVARVKANFIGGKLQIARMIVLLLAVASLLLPFGAVRYAVPFFNETLSVGILGVIRLFQNGLFPALPSMLDSALLSKQTLSGVVLAAAFVICFLFDLVIFAANFFGFLNLTRSTECMKKTALIGAVFGLLAQVVSIVLALTTADNGCARVTMGFGALASAAMLLVLFFLNRALLKKGVEPQYRQYDPARKELLRKVRAGEVDLDSLPLPIFESEEEHEARMKALEEALKAEEEGKEP